MAADTATSSSGISALAKGKKLPPPKLVSTQGEIGRNTAGAVDKAAPRASTSGARQRERRSRAMTQTFAGTPEWMAPEVVICAHDDAEVSNI